MGLKDWKKIRVLDKYYEWGSDKTNKMIYLDWDLSKNNKVFWFMSGSGSIYKKFKSRKEALKNAIKYMRTH